MRRLQILRGQLQYKPELKDGEFFLDKTNHSLLIGDTAVADGQFELAKVSAITNLQQQLDTTVPTSTSQLTNDSGFITSAQAPVQSVDGATGAVTTNAVKYTSQALTDAQKTQARTNIGAGTSSFSGSYNDLDNKPAIPNKTSELTNDSNFITSAGAPVQSVNSKTGTVTLSASDVGAVPNTRTVNGKALSANITLTASDVGALPDTTVIPTVPVYSLTKDATSADYAAVYHLTKDGTNVGEPINIPKDLFVESGEIVDNPTGQPEGKYIKLTLQNQTDPIYINVADLVDAYTAGNGITISDSNVVSANVVAGNGLSVDANGIKMGAASSTSAGAMSSADFTKLSGIEAGAQKNAVTSVNGSTGAVTITVPTKVTDLTDAANYATVTSVNAVADDVDAVAYGVEMLNDEVGTLTTDVGTLKTNITSKQNTITGGASTITDNNLTANRALISNSSGKVAVSDITDTELGYLDGVTSNIQTQIDGLDDSVLLGTVEGSETISMPTIADWVSIAYGNEKFVAIATNSNGNSQAAYSKDGITWTLTTVPNPALRKWYSVAYGDGKFVAVSRNSSHAMYSTDGINWTEAAISGYNEYYSITYGNGKFVAVSSKRAAYSTDGINWSTSDLPIITGSEEWYSITYGNGKFVAVASQNNLAAYSTNGINWTSVTLPNFFDWCSIAYGDGKFVALNGQSSSSNTAAYSTNGTNWTSVTLPSTQNWNSVIYGKDKFIAFQLYSPSVIAYSTNGTNWTSATLPISDKAFISSSYGNNKFIAIVASTDTVLYSTDGITWSNKSTSNILISTEGTDITSSVYSALEPYIPTPTVPTKTSELTNDSGYITQSDGDGRYLKLSGGALNGNTKVLNGKNITFYADETGEEIYVSMYMDGNYDFVISSAATAGNSIGRLKMYNVMTPTNSYMAANKYYVDQYAPHAKLITLTVAGWDSTAKTQTVTVSGILADESKQLIIPMPAVASMTAYNDAGIQCTGQAANSLTFTATTVPTAAISVYVTYQAVIS